VEVGRVKGPGPKAIYFPSPAAFRDWLAEHHAKADEVLVGFYRKGTGKPSLTWPESVDEALCYGWIDGVRRGVDEDRYTIRFTPRRPTSNWSAVNVRKMAELEAAGRMTDAGRAAWAKRREDRTAIYTYENKPRELAPEYDRKLRAKPAAARFWDAQPPGYKRTVCFWVMGAKQEATRQKRLAQLIELCAQGKRLPGLDRSKGKKT
jgi:uncharacterized protein YdeI (YjbR/CyaY-like superfamily)